jgi:hypothetical protein
MRERERERCVEYSKFPHWLVTFNNKKYYHRRKIPPHSEIRVSGLRFGQFLNDCSLADSELYVGCLGACQYLIAIFNTRRLVKVGVSECGPGVELVRHLSGGGMSWERTGTESVSVLCSMTAVKRWMKSIHGRVLFYIEKGWNRKWKHGRTRIHAFSTIKF